MNALVRRLTEKAAPFQIEPSRLLRFALLAFRVFEGSHRNVSEESSGVALKKMVAIVEDTLNIEPCHSSTIRVIKMVNQCVRVSSQYFEGRKETPSYDVSTDRGFSAFGANNGWILGDVVLNVLHQQSVSRARGDCNDIGS